MRVIQRCYEDGAEMARDVRPMTFTYKCETVTVQMPGLYCPICGESFHTATDARDSDRALNQLKANHEGLLSASEIRRIRKRLGLTQEDAGNIIGGGPKAFCKYEKSDALPSRAIVSALTLLDKNPENLALLRRDKGIAPTITGRQKARRTQAVA